MDLGDVSAGDRHPWRSQALITMSRVNTLDIKTRTLISIDRELLARAKSVARRQGISFAELCRRTLSRVVAEQSDELPTTRPWMQYIGCIGCIGGGSKDSSTVDQVVYGRDRP